MRVTKSQRRGSVKMVVVVVVGGGMVLGCWSLFVHLKKKIGVLRVKIIQIWEVLIVILRWICIIFVLMGKCITLRIAFQNYKLSWEIIWNMRGRWFGLQYKWSAQTSVFFFREFSQAASDLFGKISEASRDSATHAATRHWRKNASSGRIFQNPLRSMPAKKLAWRKIRSSIRPKNNTVSRYRVTIRGFRVKSKWSCMTYYKQGFPK